MNVIAGSSGVGRVQEKDRAQEHIPRAGKAVELPDFPERNHGGGNDGCLKHLQGGRIRRQSVEGEKQVIDGGNVDIKMGQEVIPLQGGHGKSGASHIVKHLRENSKIIGWRTECVNPTHCPRGDEEEERGGKCRGDPRILLGGYFWLESGFRMPIPPKDRINKSTQHNQCTGPEERPGKGRAEGRDRQNSQYPHNSPAFRPGRIRKRGQERENKKAGTRNPGQPGQGHLRQAGQRCQVPEVPGKKEIFRCHGCQPAQDAPAEQAGNIRFAMNEGFLFLHKSTPCYQNGTGGIFQNSR